MFLIKAPVALSALPSMILYVLWKISKDFRFSAHTIALYILIIKCLNYILPLMLVT